MMKSFTRLAFGIAAFSFAGSLLAAPPDGPRGGSRGGTQTVTRGASGPRGGGHGGGGWHGGRGGGRGGGWHGGRGGWHGGYRGWYGGYRGWYGYPWWGWGWGWGWGYPGYWGGYYGGYYGPAGYVTAAPGAWAAVDTDVSPEESRVFLDGRYIGTADDFDGYPDYLYLRPGHYKLEFRLEGFESREIEVDARAGVKLDVSEHLKKIPGAKQYGSYDTPTPEGGVQRFWGKEKGKDSSAAIQYETEAPQGYQDYSDWRDRPEAGQAPRQGEESEGGPAPQQVAPEPVRPPASVTRGRILFRVEPPDAAVYVDDRFAGTAEELSSLSRGLQVAPGAHRIIVSRPGYGTESTQVDVTGGATETVEITLSRP
jgi:PEGA domain